MALKQIQELPLKIRTFSNAGGGSVLFKALGHPLMVTRMARLLEQLSIFKAVAVYDPLNYFTEVQALYDLSKIKVVGLFGQNIVDIGKNHEGLAVRPVTELQSCQADAVFVPAFDAGRLTAQIKNFVPLDAEIFSLDSARLEDGFLTNPRNYLDPLNFATNFVFFRDENGHHTRLVTANYWAGYNAKETALWCCLFDADGKELAQWKEQLGKGIHSIVLDSARIRERFHLGPFTGSLFVHFVKVAGHDVVKYVIDTYGDDPSILSCTHDANAWPGDLYAGLPAPHEGEKVLLWVQNSHPCSIPAHTIGLNFMGSPDVATFDRSIPGFGTCAIDLQDLLPQAVWPQQLEVRAGRYFVRPRYEVVSRGGGRLIAHTNVERTDLKPDPIIPSLSKFMGKGFILPAPLLPTAQWENTVLPTPMATDQENLPLTLIVYNNYGQEIVHYPLGRLYRADIKGININEILPSDGTRTLPQGFGHIELVYDFFQGGSADGWLHALFRYKDKTTGHVAETSFGSHIFNTPLVYKNEPQSYTGKPPGLSTRLFLRLGPAETDTLCHLIYPASTPWHAQSTTDLILFDAQGIEVCRKRVYIPCSGSMLWRFKQVFDRNQCEAAGEDAYVVVRDATCRLFGYQGLIRDGYAFSLDHMFGF